MTKLQAPLPSPLRGSSLSPKGARGYAVKEAFLTLQGEGVQSGSRAVFLRFAGCNLWSGREQDRATAQCNFCDTDFVGTDGPGGGKFAGAEALAGHVEALWGGKREGRLVVITGGEPMRRCTSAASGSRSKATALWKRRRASTGCASARRRGRTWFSAGATS